MVKFGTDGIRGIYNVDFFDKDAWHCGCAFKKKVLVVGTDTRASGTRLKQAFIAGLSNCKVFDVGICPTPMVAFLTKKLGVDYGVMITASHNLSRFNGIKFFDKTGEKINKHMERKIVRGLYTFKISENSVESVDLSKSYIDFLCSCVGESFRELTVVLDCANGAESMFAPLVFSQLGAKVISINHTPNGKNINLNCGSTHINMLKKVTKELRADLGFAFDGDGDRVVAVDKNGRVYDGDLILYILAKSNLNCGDCVVGTVLTNSGVENALKRNKIDLIRARVGDKNVASLMKKRGILLGGEKSGHIILHDYLPCGDGLLTAIKLAEICVKSNCSLCDLIDFKPFYQISKNEYLTNPETILKNADFIKSIKYLKKEHKDCKIVIRASGTESCIRIMVENKIKTKANHVCNLISDLLKAQHLI